MNNIVLPKGFGYEQECMINGEVFYIYNFAKKVWEPREWGAGLSLDLYLCAFPEVTPERVLSRFRWCGCRLFRNEQGRLTLWRGDAAVDFLGYCTIQGYKMYDCVRNMKTSYRWDQHGNLYKD